MFARRYAIFVLRDKKGRVLLQHRDSKAPKNPKHWGFFGGNIEKGEDPKETVKREAREELGIRPRFKFFGRYEIMEQDGLNEKFMFVAPPATPLSKLKKQQKEGDSLGMFSFKDTDSLKMSKGDMVIIMDLFGMKEKVGMLEVEKKVNQS